jgi:CubicO group peptidase (beta-lactamase class C family)
MHVRARLRTLVLLLSVTVAYADKPADIDHLASKYNQLRRFNGSVLVAHDGKVLLAKGYGKANFEWDIPNDPKTKFRLGSITKQFTSMVIMQLVQEGKIDLDASLVTYLPDYRKDTGAKVTVRNLLNHTSGIPSYTSDPRFLDVARDPYAVNAFVAKFASGDLRFEPGTKYEYDNSGYFLLGAIIEKVTGKTYEQSVQERIFTPLGMKDTGYDHFETVIPHRAGGYERNGSSYRNATYIDMSIPYAAGSLYSTVEDLFTWDRALYTDKLLQPKYRDMMFVPKLEHYGFGWIIAPLALSPAKSVDTIQHDGGIPGFNTTLVRIPADHYLIVALDNASDGKGVHDLGVDIARVLYDQPVKEPVLSVSEAFYEQIEKKGLDAVLPQLQDLRKTKSTAYDSSEPAMNELGYQLLRNGKPADAIKVFRLNTEDFPASFNAWDSLGEAYASSGDTKQAVEAYARSVELNPKNTNGADRLKALQTPATDVTPAFLKACVGTYRITEDFSITIMESEGKLYGQATGQSRFSMTPISATDFRIDVVAATITFVPDAQGKVDQLILHQGGRDTPAKRTK